MFGSRQSHKYSGFPHLQLVSSPKIWEPSLGIPSLLIPAQFQGLGLGRGFITGFVGCSRRFHGWKDGNEAAELTCNERRWLHGGFQRGLALSCVFFPISTIPGVFPRLGMSLEPPLDLSHLQTCGGRMNPML